MYDLIVLGYAADYLPIFAELDGQRNVHLIPPFWNHQRELLHFLVQMDFAYKKGKVPLLPNCNPAAGTAACYIFFRDWYPLFASGYIKRLKELLPDTKACWFFSDLVNTYPNINIERMQREFDLILSFDPEDAKRYGFIYCPLPYSALPEAEKWKKQTLQSDVFFMGSAKQRLEMIFAVYERLRKYGLNCDFHIIGASLQDRRYVNEINYCDFLPYKDYLKRALSSRCLLEILQDPTHHGFTVRTAETLVYGKKLLSNNMHLAATDFYDSRQMSIFSNSESLNSDFITNRWQPTCMPTVFSPIYALKLIEKHLDIKFAFYTETHSKVGFEE